MSSLFFKNEGRFAILSPEFITAKVHYDRANRKYVLCLAPQNCKYCQVSNQAQSRWGAWVWDYSEIGQYPIKLFGHASAQLNKVFYAILKNGGLQFDFMAEKRTSANNRTSLYVTKQEGSPAWFVNFPDKVREAWKTYAQKDIRSYLGKNLTYAEQEQLLFTQNPNAHQGNAPSGGGSQISDFLNGSGNQNNPHGNYSGGYVSPQSQSQSSHHSYQPQPSTYSQNQSQQSQQPYSPLPQGDPDDLL